MMAARLQLWDSFRPAPAALWPWRLLVVGTVVGCLVSTADAAPFPAHLVVHGGHQWPDHTHHTVAWQEYPVALNPVNASALFKPILNGTDHGLYNEGFFEGDILRTKHDHNKADADTKNAVTDPNLLWPSATVVYKVDDDVGCPESPQCTILMTAMDHYHEHSCIRFKQWTGEDNWVSIFFNTDSSGSCWSPVGRVGDGEQRLSLGQRCWYHGIVVHELGHAIGFWHEMNRPDRDDWIYVYWQNIIPGFASAFRKHARVATLGEHFDYRSIMMYDEYAFSKDGRSPTLQATTGEEIGPIWRKRGLSASDKRRLEKLYKCDPKKPKSGFPYDVNCDFNKHVCGFKNGGSPNWNWRTVNQTDGYVYTSFDTAGTTPGHFMSINFPPISNAMESVRGELGCVRFYYLIETDGEAQLILDQAYLKKVTQLNHDEDATFELWSNDTSANEWIHMEIPLYVTRPFKLIFTSTFNNTATHGTIALDDVELLYTPCNPSPMSTSGSETSTTTATSVMPAAPKPIKKKPKPHKNKPKPPRPITSPSTTTPTPTEPAETESEDFSSAGVTSTSSSSSSSSMSSTTDSSSGSGSSTTVESTTTSFGLMTTAQTELSIQQQQLQQQQTILAAQQLMEQQQQQVQQQQLLEMAQNLQQHVSQHAAAHKHHPHGHNTTPTPSPDTADSAATTFPSYQTLGSVTETSGVDEFPVKLSESYEPSPAQKVPNLPDPTDRIPMKNPHPQSTSTPSSLNYDVDECLDGR